MTPFFSPDDFITIVCSVYSKEGEADFDKKLCIEEIDKEGILWCSDEDGEEYEVDPFNATLIKENRNDKT